MIGNSKLDKIMGKLLQNDEKQETRDNGNRIDA